MSHVEVMFVRRRSRLSADTVRLFQFLIGEFD
jgi:hypothetical protein